MNKLVSFLVCFIFLALASCSSYKNIECSGIKSFKVNMINKSGIEAEVFLLITNPNRIGFTIYKSEFDIEYSGVNLGKARLLKKVHLKGKKEEVYGFVIRNDFKNVNVLDVLKLLSSINFSNTIKVDGNLKVGKFFLRKSLPIHQEQTIGGS